MREASRPDDDDAPRPWRGAVVHLGIPLTAGLLLMAGVVLLVMEELWVLVVALAVAAAVFYAVMDWLNGGSWWD